jgi:hypothetical protein
MTQSMSPWTADELDRVGNASELRVAGRRKNGSLRNGVIIWSVRVDDEIYIRSVYGPEASWFRGTQVSGDGRIEAGGVTKDVTYVSVDDLNDIIDSAYHRKYGGGSAVKAITTPLAATTTLRVDPK